MQYNCQIRGRTGLNQHESVRTDRLTTIQTEIDSIVCFDLYMSSAVVVRKESNEKEINFKEEDTLQFCDTIQIEAFEEIEEEAMNKEKRIRTVTFSELPDEKYHYEVKKTKICVLI